MKTTTLAIVGLVGLSAMSFADESKVLDHHWQVRLRATDLVPSDKSDAFSALGVNFGANAVHVSPKIIPEIDVDYFFNEKWSAELVLTNPQRHDVTLAGVGHIGTLTHLPPSLLAQYHFKIGRCPLDPYIGAGVNFTILSSNLGVGATNLDLSPNSFGIAYQIGFDYKLNEHWLLNLDYKYINLHANVKAGNAVLTQANVNPSLFAIGVGYRF